MATPKTSEGVRPTPSRPTTPGGCPHCGGARLPGRAYCRPSCRVRFEWRQHQRGLFEADRPLESEWR